MIFVPEVIGRVIDAMREEGNYESWTQSGTLYTIETAYELKEDQWIIILDTPLAFGFEFAFPIVFTDDIGGILAEPLVFGQFQAINVTSTSFDIVSLIDPPAVGGWKSLEPFYMYGVPLEIATRLMQKDKDKIYKYQKYPLFALQLPIEEDVQFNGLHDVTTNIAILAFSSKTYRAPERFEKVFHPVLMPLYFDFLDKLQSNGEILTAGIPQHTKRDIPFYGTEELGGNRSYIFNDPLDGITMTNLEIQLIDKC